MQFAFLWPLFFIWLKFQKFLRNVPFQIRRNLNLMKQYLSPFPSGSIINQSFCSLYRAIGTCFRTYIGTLRSSGKSVCYERERGIKKEEDRKGRRPAPWRPSRTPTTPSSFIVFSLAITKRTHHSIPPPIPAVMSCMCCICVNAFSFLISFKCFLIKRADSFYTFFMFFLIRLLLPNLAFL